MTGSTYDFWVNLGSPAPGAMRVVLRPHLWRRPEVLALAVFVPFTLGGWWRHPDPGPLWATLLVVALLAAALWPGRAWLVITEHAVSCSWSLASDRRTWTRRVPRQGIAAVDVWRDRVVLSGASGQVLLSLRPCWTLAQCAEMAARLGVPAVRHKGRKPR